MTIVRETGNDNNDELEEWTVREHAHDCALGRCRHPSHYTVGDEGDSLTLDDLEQRRCDDPDSVVEGWCARCRYVAAGLSGGRGYASGGLGATELSLDEMVELDARLDALYGRQWRLSNRQLGLA